jgi:hypothetical protein
VLAAPFLPEQLRADFAESQPGRAHARTHTLTHTLTLSHKPRRLPGDPVADHRSNPVAQPRVLQSQSVHTRSRWWVLVSRRKKRPLVCPSLWPSFPHSLPPSPALALALTPAHTHTCMDTRTSGSMFAMAAESNAHSSCAACHKRGSERGMARHTRRSARCWVRQPVKSHAMLGFFSCASIPFPSDSELVF